MELTHLEILLEVVRRGSFAATARARQVDPSSISRAVSSLEAELGLRLLHRSTRRLALTEAGRRYVEQVEPLVAGLADAAHIAGDLARVPSGRVRASLPVSFGLRCIVPILPAIRSDLPEVRLDLQLSDARVDLLADGMDFAIRLGHIDDPGLVTRRLRRVRYRCVASPSYLSERGAPRSPRDLVEHPALRFPLPAVGAIWRFRRGDQVQEIAVSGPLVIGNTLALRGAATAGLGVTVLPDWLVDRDIEGGRLSALLEDYEVTLSTFDASAWLVFPARRYIPARVRAVTDLIVEHLT